MPRKYAPDFASPPLGQAAVDVLRVLGVPAGGAGTAPPHVPLPPNTAGVPSSIASSGIQLSIAEPLLEAPIMPTGTSGLRASSSRAAYQHAAGGYLTPKSGVAPTARRFVMVAGLDAAHSYGAFDGQSAALLFGRPVGTGHGLSVKSRMRRLG